MGTIKIVVFQLIVLFILTSSCYHKTSAIVKYSDNTYDSLNTKIEVPKVSVIKLAYNDFIKEILSNGKLIAFRKADLTFRSVQSIDTIYVKNGDRVKKGQIIAKLDEFSLSSTLKMCQYQLEQIKIEMQDILLSQGFDYEDTCNVPKNNLNSAKGRSGFNKAQNDLELAKYNLDASRIRAPYSGVIANLFIKEKNLSSQTERFCTIIDDSQFEAEFPILETELTSVKRGQKVRIIPYSSNNLEIKGEITKINPIVDQNGMVKVDAICNNSNYELFDGMNVKIILEEKVSHKISIPKQAIVLRADKQVVFIYKSGLAKWIYVKTGLENINSYVVNEGLQDGDTLIYKGNLNLSNNTRVEIDN